MLRVVALTSFVVQSLCKFLGLFSLGCVGPRGQPAQSRVGSILVVQLLIRTHISLCYWYEEALLRRVRYRGVFCAARRLPGEDSDGRALEIVAAEHPRSIGQRMHRVDLASLRGQAEGAPQPR